MKDKKLSVIFLILFLFSGINIMGVAGKKLNLEEAISEALENNTLIKESEEMVRASLSEKKSAERDLYPKFSTNYSYNRLTFSPEVSFMNQSFPFGPKNNFSWNVGISQPIFMGNRLRIKAKLAGLGVNIKKLKRENALLDVVEMTKTAYFQVLLARRGVEIAEEEVSQLKSHLKDAKNLYKEGMIPHNDLLKSQVAYAAAKENLVKAKSNLKVAISNLNRILRRKIDEDTDIEDINRPEFKEYVLKSLYDEALQKRPEIKLLNEQLKQANLMVKLSKSSYYPDVYLVGRYEQEGDNPWATNNDYRNYHNFMFGIQLKWNFYECGKKGYEVKRRKFERNALFEKIKGVKDSILLEVKSSYENLEVSKKNIDTARIALKQARENYRITNLRYREGITNSTEVLDARTYLTEAEVHYYGALYGYFISEAKLLRAVGRKR